MENGFTRHIFATAKQCGVEQLVARRAHNPEVGGSSPSPATRTEGWKIFRPFFMRNGYVYCLCPLCTQV